MTRILAFAASHRASSVNRRLARYAGDLAGQAGAEIDFAEYREFDLPIFDADRWETGDLPPAALHFAGRLSAADGWLLASPEYNWSFPGSLKNLIDWASVLQPLPFVGKTALLLSASPSLRGGMQGLLHLKLPLEHLGMFVYPQFFPLARAEDAFGGQNHIGDEKLARELEDLVARFLRYTVQLAAL